MTGQGTRAVSTNFGGGSCATVTLKGSRWLVAVFAFYTLSGFLLTRLHNDRYGFSMRGPAGFLLNRVLGFGPPISRFSDTSGGLPFVIEPRRLAPPHTKPRGGSYSRRRTSAIRSRSMAACSERAA
jgi:hypothetical protein